MIFKTELLKNKNSKLLWKNIKNIVFADKSKNITLPQKLKSSEGDVEDSFNIIDDLNKQFVNISTHIEKVEFHEQNCSLKLRINSILRDSEFNISFITPFEVRKIIDKLDHNKSTGKDGIEPKILKHCGDTITKCIASIINNSISSGIFPDKLKEASVIPIFKSGMKDLAENYRPISILPTISKIYERHIAAQIQEYSGKN